MSDCQILDPRMDYFTFLLDQSAYEEEVPYQ